MNFIIFIFFLKIYFISSQNCGIYLPNQFLTPIGLSTPFILKTISSNIPCSAINSKTTVFVEATIFDKSTGKLTIYNPLVVNNLSQVAIYPDIPTFASDSVVGLWFSSTVLSFSFINVYPGCIDGTLRNKFGYFAYCNADVFFEEIRNNINKIIQGGVPILSLNCPTIRSFSFINQYQNYKTLTSYILTNKLQIAQNTVNNRKNLNIMSIIEEYPDGNKLLVNYIHKLLSCETYQVYDNIETNVLKYSLALNEIQTYISRNDVTTRAYLSESNPMILFDYEKFNLYKLGINQPMNISHNMKDYCISLYKETHQFLSINYDKMIITPSPDNYKGPNLLIFMVIRFMSTWIELNCFKYTNMTSPIIITYDEKSNIMTNLQPKENNTNLQPNNTKENNINLQPKENNNGYSTIVIILSSFICIIVCCFSFLLYTLFKKHNKDLKEINNKILFSFTKIIKDYTFQDPDIKLDDEEKGFDKIYEDMMIDFEKIYNEIDDVNKMIQLDREIKKIELNKRLENRTIIRNI